MDSYRHTCEQLLAVGEQQERLIEALLTLSRSQRGLGSHQPVDLAAIAATAATAADHDGLVFDANLRPARTTGDPRLVERLAANLISNAIRHNAGELERIFEPFQRLDSARTADANGPGLGLGLSIVKAIADAHNATITTRGKSDGGLHIEVAFPAAAPSDGD
jgi:signal transduction histidine kinase